MSALAGAGRPGAGPGDARTSPVPAGRSVDRRPARSPSRGSGRGSPPAEAFADGAAGEDVFRAVSALAGDGDPEVRLQAAFSLGAWPSPKVEPVLRELAARDDADEWQKVAVQSSIDPGSALFGALTTARLFPSRSPWRVQTELRRPDRGDRGVRGPGRAAGRRRTRASPVHEPVRDVPSVARRRQRGRSGFGDGGQPRKPPGCCTRSSIPTRRSTPVPGLERHVEVRRRRRWVTAPRPPTTSSCGWPGEPSTPS